MIVRSQLARIFALPALALVTALGGCAGTAATPLDPGNSNPAASAATPDAGGNLTVGLTYIPNIQFSPLYVGTQNQLFGETRVQLRHHGQNEGLFNALLSGTEDAVIAGIDEAAVASNGELLAISPYYSAYPATIIVPAQSEVTTIADLRGKRIGLPGKFGENWYALLAALKKAGISLSEVEIQEIGYTQLAALSTGKVDAVVGFINNDSVQFDLAGFPVRSLPLGDLGLIGAGVITTKSFAREHPQELRDLVAGLNQSFQMIRTNPQSAIMAGKAYIDQLQEPESVRGTQAVLNATIPLLPLPADCWKLDQQRERNLRQALKQSVDPQFFDESVSLLSTDYCE